MPLLKFPLKTYGVKDPAPERRWASNSYPSAPEAANDPVR